MKTSNKLLISIGLITIAILTIYNFGLKAAYNKAEYKNRFYNMVDKKIGAFNTIENNASNLNVRIEQGQKFEIWCDEDIKDKVIITKRNKHLVIGYKKENNEDDYFRYGSIIIICPEIQSLIVNPLQLNSNKKGGKALDTYIPEGETIIYGFKQKQLNLKVNTITKLSLFKNKLDGLLAGVGNSNTSKAILNLEKDNEIKSLEVDVRGKSVLNLFSPSINSAQFQLSDSADVNLSGRALKLLKN